MTSLGIESLHFYGGSAYLEARELFEARGLDLRRFDNLMIHRKSVALPCEDPVSYAVNAAKPIVDALPPAERDRIELLITATESGLDFGKSLSTYIHHYLGLNRSCRLFEVKQACYGGTAGLQTALNFVASNVSPGAKALVIATDIAKAAAKGTYVEPSQGAGSVAMLVSTVPDVLEIDFGANGYHSYEVMDTCRPTPEIETGDSDLSLVSYLECLQGSFAMYAERVEGADYVDTFDFLAFHTPFPGMVKGAHRMLLRKLKRMPTPEAEADFERRVTPSLSYCSAVGNIYSGTVYLALAGLIDTVDLSSPRRVGFFSYGSGCSSEFFSGVISARSKEKLAQHGLQAALDRRMRLDMGEYDRILDGCMDWPFGTRDKEVDLTAYQEVYDRTMAGQGLLRLARITDYHREYEWT